MQKIKNYLLIPLGEASFYFILIIISIRILIALYVIFIFIPFAPNDISSIILLIPIGYPLLIIQHYLPLLIIFLLIFLRVYSKHAKQSLATISSKYIIGFILIFIFIGFNIYNKNQFIDFNGNHFFLNLFGFYPQEQKNINNEIKDAENNQSLDQCNNIKSFTDKEECQDRVMKKLLNKEGCEPLKLDEYEIPDFSPYIRCLANVAYNTQDYSICEYSDLTRSESEINESTYACYFNLKDIIYREHDDAINFNKGLLEQSKSFKIEKSQMELMCRRLNELYLINWPDDNKTRESRNSTCYGDKLI